MAFSPCSRKSRRSAQMTSSLSLLREPRSRPAGFLASFLSLGVMFWPYMIHYSITVASAAAPDASLRFLFYGGIFVLPIIAAYTIGVYWVFRGKLGMADG